MLAIWIGVTLGVFAFTLSQAPDRDERSVYSDLATHVMIASSIWHDGDLQYSLSDLERFRNDFPSAAGPTGLFLKANRDGEIAYAKPYLYGVVAACFYGLLGVSGFLLLNSLCLASVGCIAGLSLKDALGIRWANIAALGFVLPSPFLVWVHVPHPDVFIAALLSTGGYFLISPGVRWRRVIGATLLGCVLHEKIPFLFVVPFLLLVADAQSWKQRAVLASVVMAAWFVAILPNILFDGSLLSYQGHRFYVGGAPFPLEEGWDMSNRGMFSDDAFSPFAVLPVIAGNLALLGPKLQDFLIGRQTGIIPYFTMAFVLLLLRGFATYSRAGMALIGFFAYLAVNWLVFPTNGYGGTGTYGSRYLMQAIGLIPLSFVGAVLVSQKRVWMAVRVSIIVIFIAAACLQNRVFVDGHELVYRYYRAVIERPYTYFPIELTLLPTIFEGASDKFVERSRSGYNILFPLSEVSRETIFASRRDNTISRYILYRSGTAGGVQYLELFSLHSGEVRVEGREGTVWSGKISPGQPQKIEVRKLDYDRSFYDFLDRRSKGFTILDVIHLKTESAAKHGAFMSVLRFARDYPFFKGYGDSLSVGDFRESGLLLEDGWSHIEPWGVWSDGDFASILAKVGAAERKFDIRFRVHGYVPPPLTSQPVTVAINGNVVGDLDLLSEPLDHTFRVFKPEGVEFLHVLYRIGQPISPFSVGRGNDPRHLGLGLSRFWISRVTEKGVE